MILAWASLFNHLHGFDKKKTFHPFVKNIIIKMLKT